MIYQHALLAKRRIINSTYFAIELSLSVALESVGCGQFFMLKKLHPPAGGFLPRPFGIYDFAKGSDGSITAITLLIKVVGKTTRILFDAELGTPFSLAGPLGNGFTVPGPYESVIAVAGGIGIAPFLLVGRKLQKRHASFSLLYGGKSDEDYDIVRQFEKEGFEINLASEDGSFGEKGLVTDLLDDKLNSIHNKQSCLILACGPEPMLRNVAFKANRRGIDCQLSLESMMACGIGTCHGCVVPVRDKDGRLTYKRVCKEGPVFDAGCFWFDKQWRGNH